MKDKEMFELNMAKILERAKMQSKVYLRAKHLGYDVVFFEEITNVGSIGYGIRCHFWYFGEKTKIGHRVQYGELSNKTENLDLIKKSVGNRFNIDEIVEKYEKFEQSKIK